ncbi:MAG: hypothetical protein IT580_20320 [Verrucomicrobiales bacterium]|nr:hypothetical protein [Verrucomicrobiales bacterium]
MKWLLWTVLSLGALWLLYVVVANLALRSTRFRQSLNQHPDKFFITWNSVVTWFPGIFHSRGVEFVGQGSHSTYYGRVDEAHFRVRFLPLLGGEIVTPHFAGSGVEFRFRQPPKTPDESPATNRFGPDIPHLDQLPHRTAPRSPSRPASRWRLRAEDVHLQQIRQVWINGTRFHGDGTLEAALELKFDGPLHVRARQLSFPSATLEQDGTRLATEVALSATGELGPLTFGVDDVPSEKLYDFITADTTLRANLHSLALLRRRVGHALHVEFGGDGLVEGTIRVRRGQLEPGSRTTLTSPALSVRLAGLLFQGNATLTDEVAPQETNPPTALLRVELKDLVVTDGTQVLGSAPGRVLELESATQDLAIARLFQDASLAFRLHPITLPDASVLNPWIPVHTGIRFQKGSLIAQAEMSAGTNAAGRGRLELSGQGLTALVHEQHCATDLLLQVPLALDPGAPGRVRVDGTSLLLTNVTVSGAARSSSDPWHAHLTVPSGELSFASSNQWAVEARIGISLRDTRPLVAVLTEQEAVPGWIRHLPTLRDLVGSASVHASPEISRLRDVRIDGANIEVRAELELEGNATRGIAYARYGLISAGFDLRAPKRSWRIFGARRWYDAALSSPLHPPEHPDSEPESSDPPAAAGVERPD